MKDKPKIEFPCRYPIKVIAVASEGTARRVFDIVRKHAPELTPDDVLDARRKQERYLYA